MLRSLCQLTMCFRLAMLVVRMGLDILTRKLHRSMYLRLTLRYGGIKLRGIGCPWGCVRRILS